MFYYNKHLRADVQTAQVGRVFRWTRDDRCVVRTIAIAAPSFALTYGKTAIAGAARTAQQTHEHRTGRTDYELKCDSATCITPHADVLRVRGERVVS